MSDQLTTQALPSPPTTPSQPPRRIGISFRKSYARRVESGFIAKYLSKADIIDIGFRGRAVGMCLKTAETAYIAEGRAAVCP